MLLIDVELFLTLILKITFLVCLDGSGLKFIFHLKACSLIFAKSLLSSEELIVTS